MCRYNPGQTSKKGGPRAVTCSGLRDGAWEAYRTYITCRIRTQRFPALLRLANRVTDAHCLRTAQYDALHETEGWGHIDFKMDMIQVYMSFENFKTSEMS